MKCKNCQTELEAGVTRCPNCGTEKTGLGAGKIALLVVLAIAAVAVIVALVMGGGTGAKPAETTVPVATTDPAAPTETLGTGTVAEPTIPADGNPDDVTCKGSYTVSDEEMIAAASTVVATMGDVELTNSELQVYYWMQVIDFLNAYGSYASMMGLDYTQPMDSQLSMDGTTSWQQYFLQAALESWFNYQAMSQEAIDNNFVMDQEYADYLAELPAALEESAAELGYENAEIMIQADMGAGATLDAYMSYLNAYYMGYMYYGATMEQMAVTAEEVEAYFDAHAEEYLANNLEKNDECYVDVRHILICPEGGTTAEDGTTTYSDEEWAAAQTKADELLNQWLSGDASEESFAALAQTYSEDPGSASTGGLYEDVYVGQMVPNFENWCFDASRQPGDYGIVQTTYGYHIMYFVGSDLVWFLTAETDMMTEKGNEFLSQVLDNHPVEIDFSAIALGEVDLTSTG